MLRMDFALILYSHGCDCVSGPKTTLGSHMVRRTSFLPPSDAFRIHALLRLAPRRSTVLTSIFPVQTKTMITNIETIPKNNNFDIHTRGPELLGGAVASEWEIARGLPVSARKGPRRMLCGACDGRRRFEALARIVSRAVSPSRPHAPPLGGFFQALVVRGSAPPIFRPIALVLARRASRSSAMRPA